MPAQELAPGPAGAVGGKGGTHPADGAAQAPPQRRGGRPAKLGRAVRRDLAARSGEGWPRLVRLASVGLTALALVLYTRNRGVPGAEPFFDPVTPAVALVFPALGAFLVSRRPGQAVGWLFCTGVLLAVALFADQYAAYALATSPGSLPGGLWMAWIGSWVWIPGFLAIRTLLLLLFPDGRPPSAHWTPVARLTAAVIGAMTVLAAVANLPGLDAPSAVKALPHLSGLLLAPIALAGLIARYRRSVGLERAQLRWFTVAAAAATLVPLLAAAFALLTPGAFASPWLRYLYQGAGVVSLLALPAATVVALLRHRLYDLDAYDLDTLVDRSLLYAGLGAVVALAYWGVVSLLGGGLLEEVFSVKPGLATSLVAAGVVAAAWRPLRKLLELGLDRLRYDKLAAEALARLGRRLEATLTPEEVLPAIVETIASALRVPYVAVEVTSGERVIAAAAHGEPGTADVVVKLVHQAEEIGRLLVGTRSPQEPLSDGHRRLLDELASQAGVAASVVRLTAELQRSRARVVAAADAERRRIERNIHDGAQQHLVALAVNLRLVRDLGMDDPEQAGAMLDQLAKDVRDTLQELRDLAHGIYPPLLVDSGLEQALRAAVNRSPLDAEVDTARIERYPAEVEAAVYFCCLEALQNAAKHAGPGASVTIRVAEEEGMLVFTVADDGVGFDPAVVVWNDGFTNMSDRLGAIGGALHLDSEPGHGTRVSGTIPLP